MEERQEEGKKTISHCLEKTKQVQGRQMGGHVWIVLCRGWEVRVGITQSSKVTWLLTVMGPP